MKATLYEALGVSRLAPQEEIRAALRAHIRKYYANTRDGHGNLEEALRFINHASCILTDPRRRALYDQELAVSDGSVEQRIQHVVSGAVSHGDEPSLPSDAPDDDVPSLRQDGQLPVTPSSVHPGLIEHVGSLPHATSVAIAACASFIVLIATAIVFVTPADALVVARQVLITLTAALVSLAIIYAVVHVMSLRRRGAGYGAQTSQDQRAILNWRREKSVFFGSHVPQEDAGWIFKLRMAELERAKVARTSQPRPWNRLGARLFDYALWGLTLGLVVTELRALGLLPAPVVYWLTHPFLAPILICATWVPVESVLTAFAGTTPGKWLFGVFLQFSISDAYADRARPSQFKRAFRRAFHVWWLGVGGGVPLLAPVLMAIAHEKLARDQETTWDCAQDCLVTHAPPSAFNAATGIVGFAAMVWLYGVAWQPTMQASIASARNSFVAALPSPSSLWSASWGGRAGTIIDGSLSDIRIPGLQGSMVRSASSPASNAGRAGTASQPIDPDLAKLFAARRERIDNLRSEGLRMLEAHNWRRAGEVCRAWVDLDLGNSEAWRCVARAAQREGRHQEAINAFRKAKRFDPDDRTLDTAISSSEQAIVTEFLSTAH